MINKLKFIVTFFLTVTRFFFKHLKLIQITRKAACIGAVSIEVFDANYVILTKSERY